VGLTGQNASQRNVEGTEAVGVASSPVARPRNIHQRQVRLAESRIEALVNTRLSSRTDQPAG